MTDKKNTGLGCFGTIGVVLIILKLFNLITLSWWLVLLPIYGPLALLLIIAIIAAIF